MATILRGLKRIPARSFSRCFSSRNEPRVAVLLHGCGVYDGTEIQEATSALFALSRKNAKTQCFSISGSQMHVVDHTKGEADEKDDRSLIVESSRISRGDCKNLDDLEFNARGLPHNS